MPRSQQTTQAPPSSPYKSPSNYIDHQLIWLDTKIKTALDNIKWPQIVDAGYTITSEAVRALLNSDSNEMHESKNNLQTKALNIQHQIEKNLQKTREQGIALPIDGLCKVFPLSNKEIEIIIICLAPHIETKYDRIYAYLQGDSTRKFPTLDLIFKLLNADTDKRAEITELVSENSMLRYWQIIDFLNEKDQWKSSPLTLPLRLDGKIVDYLQSNESLEPEVADIALIIRDQRIQSDLYIPDELKERVSRINSQYIYQEDNYRTANLFAFYGPSNQTKLQTSISILNKTCKSLYWTFNTFTLKPVSIGQFACIRVPF